MSKEIMIGIRNPEDTAQDFIEAWHRAENGEPVERPVERIWFKDLDTMLKVMASRDLPE